VQVIRNWRKPAVIWALLCAVLIVGVVAGVLETKHIIAKFVSETPSVSFLRLTNSATRPMEFECTPPKAWMKRLYIATPLDVSRRTGWEQISLEGELRVTDDNGKTTNLSFATLPLERGVLGDENLSAYPTQCFNRQGKVDLGTVLDDGKHYVIAVRFKSTPTNELTMWLACVYPSGHTKGITH
jgi:hypothetical protein